MVAVRRIKHLVQLSAVGLLILTFVIFIQWDEISYKNRFKRQANGFREQLQYSHDQELLELERELDVGRILKRIHDDVTLRLLKEEEICNKSREQTSTRQLPDNINNKHESSTVISKETKTKIQPEAKATVSPLSRQKEASREREHRRHMKQFKWQTYPWKPNMRGQLNVHIWQSWCGNTIHDLRRNWFFPSYPDLHLTVSRFFVQHYEDDYGQRIFGFIHPPLTGKYVFALSSDDTSELWLSKDENPENVRLLAWVGNRTSLDGYYKTNVAEFTKYKTQLSKQVYLKKGRRYYVEALHKQGAREDHILVGWKVPGLSRFRYISGDSISMYIDDRYVSPDVTEYKKFIPQTLPCHTHSHTWSVVLNKDVHKFGSNKEHNEYRKHQIVKTKDFDNILPNCTYQPSYLVNFTLKRYEGVKLIHDSAVYPNDFTLLTHMIPFDQCRARRTTDSHGNSLHVTVPTLTNHTLYKEGKIKIFGPDGKSLVVTTHSDLTEDYPNESLLKSDEFNSSEQENHSLSLDHAEKEINVEENHRKSQSQNNFFNDKEERNRLLNGIQKHYKTLQNQDLKIKVNYNRDTQSSLKKVKIVTRKQQLSNSKRVKSRQNRTKHPTVKSAANLKQNLKQSNQNYAKLKITKRNEKRTQPLKNSQRKRILANKDTRKDDSKKTKLKERNVQRQSQQTNHKNNELQKSSRSERSVQENTNPRKSDLDINSYNKQTHTNSKKRAVQSSRQVKDKRYRRTNQSKQFVQQGNSQTRRKLLYYPTNEASNDNDDAEGQVRSAKKTHDAVPRFYFRPIGTVAYNHSEPNFMFEDRHMTRLNNAREYVRRMQLLIQIYQHPMSGRQISDQIYRRYGIRMRVPEMKPYLDYNALLFHHNTTKCASDGNLLLNEHVARSVVSRYMEELTRKTSNKYSLQRIINIQENHDVMFGDRYLMELDLLDQTKNESVRLSQYIYQKSGHTNLCLPHNFQINHHATVHVIVPVKNQGRWVQYFIDDMAELYLKTGDPHLNVIIVDFSSDDIDVVLALRRSALVRYKVITLTGPFQRAFGIQAGSTAVKNPNDIIFMCDLHLELPNNMIDIIRKHCIQGKMAFAPVVTRLHCGFTPAVPFGFWELQGYGLFAMYKSDFTRVGGMNYKEFGTRWGGEDWELLDRVLLRKMEVERLRIPKFYHFYHSKKGMWGSPTTDTVLSDISDYYRSKDQIIPLYKRNVVMVPANRRPSRVGGNYGHRNLRKKRKPVTKMVRPPSRVRRGYRPRKRKKPVEIEQERDY